MESASLPSPSHVWLARILAATLATIVGVSDGRRWFVSPGRLIVFTLLGLLVLNTLVFSTNLLLSMRGWASARTEQKLEAKVVRTVKGPPASLPAAAARWSVLFMMACGGAIVGAAVAALIRAFR